MICHKRRVQISFQAIMNYVGCAELTIVQQLLNFQFAIRNPNLISVVI